MCCCISLGSCTLLYKPRTYLHVFVDCEHSSPQSALHTCYVCFRPPAATGVVSAAPIRYKTDDRVDSNIVTAAQVAMLGMLPSWFFTLVLNCDVTTLMFFIA